MTCVLANESRVAHRSRCLFNLYLMEKFSDWMCGGYVLHQVVVYYDNECMARK